MDKVLDVLMAAALFWVAACLWLIARDLRTR